MREAPLIPEEAVQAVAEVLFQDYASEYDADHLSPRDFWFQARRVLHAVVPVLAAELESLRESAKTAEHALRDALPAITSGKAWEAEHIIRRALDGIQGAGRG